MPLKTAHCRVAQAHRAKVGGLVPQSIATWGRANGCVLRRAIRERRAPNDRRGETSTKRVSRPNGGLLGAEREHRAEGSLQWTGHLGTSSHDRSSGVLAER